MQTKQIDLEALPIEVKESRLTDTQKKVLNVFYTYNTLDKTNENGSFFIDNITLKNEAAVSGNDTLQRALSFLITNRFIDRIAGSRTKENGSVASTYVLHTDNIIDWCKLNKQTKKKQGYDVKGMMFDNHTNHHTNKNADLKSEIEVLKAQNKELNSKVDKLISMVMGMMQGYDVKGMINEHHTTDIDKEIDINRSDIYTCNLKDSNEIEIRSSKVGNISDGESNNGDISDLNDVNDGSDCESTPKENEELKDEDMQQFTAEEVKALNEYYGREWKELQEVRESESMKHKGEYVELSKKIDNFNELFRSYYDSKNINTFTERERQLWSLKSQIEENATHLRLTDKQIDYILSLEVTLQKAMAGKKKFKEKVVKSQTVKAEQQAQPKANVTSNREIISRQQERPCRVHSADGDLSDEINKLFI